MVRSIAGLAFVAGFRISDGMIWVTIYERKHPTSARKQLDFKLLKPFPPLQNDALNGHEKRFWWFVTSHQFLFCQQAHPMRVLGTTTFKPRQNHEKSIKTCGYSTSLRHRKKWWHVFPELQVVVPKISVSFLMFFFPPGKTHLKTQTWEWSSTMEAAFSGSIFVRACKRSIHINRWWLMLYLTSLCFDGSQPISCGGISKSRWKNPLVFTPADNKKGQQRIIYLTSWSTASCFSQNQTHQCSKSFRSRESWREEGVKLGKFASVLGGFPQSAQN